MTLSQKENYCVRKRKVITSSPIVQSETSLKKDDARGKMYCSSGGKGGKTGAEEKGKNEENPLPKT